MYSFAHHRVSGGLVVVASVAGVLSGPALATASPGRSSSDSTATAVTPARGIAYGGSTSSKDPIVVTLSRSGSRMTQLSTQIGAKCADGGVNVVRVGPVANYAIGRDGSVHGTKTRTVSNLNGGFSAVETANLTAKVRGLQLSGSVKVHADIIDTAHAVVTTCDRTATFKAVASKGRVFAGVTSQGRPVVLELTANGASVHHFHIGWQAFCKSGRKFSWGDTLVNFPISRGRFGDSFGQKYSDPDGSTWVERYSLRGGMSGLRAAGTFRWNSAGTDATGAPFGCDTGSVSFRTNSG